MSKLNQLKALVKASMDELAVLHAEKGDVIKNDSVINIDELPPVTQLLWFHGLPVIHIDTLMDKALVNMVNKIVNNYQYAIHNKAIAGETLGKTASYFTLVVSVFDGVLYKTVDTMDDKAKEAIYPLVSELTDWCEEIKDVSVRRFLTHQCYETLYKIYDAILTINVDE